MYRNIVFLRYLSVVNNSNVKVLSFTCSSPPFQISRRGWGEFPIRVQLYFHDRINQKPLQIYHNLILDKKMTGLQTMGECSFSAFNCLVNHTECVM